MKFKYLLFFLMLCSSHAVLAAYEGGSYKVASLRIDAGGVSVEFKPAPLACNGGSQYRMHAHVSTASSNYNVMVSTLLTAHTTGQPFRYIFYADLPAGVSACGPNDILELTHIEFIGK